MEGNFNFFFIAVHVWRFKRLCTTTEEFKTRGRTRQDGQWFQRQNYGDNERGVMFYLYSKFYFGFIYKNTQFFDISRDQTFSLRFKNIIESIVLYWLIFICLSFHHFQSFVWASVCLTEFFKLFISFFLKYRLNFFIQ